VPNPHSVLLLGENHTDYGAVAVEEISDDLAVAISRGRFPKSYPHVDPNEDAVFASTDGTFTVMAVADGHNGFDAARAAIEAIRDSAADTVTHAIEDGISLLAGAAIAAVAEFVPDLAPPRDTSRTALTVCVIRDDEISSITLGDTSCLAVSRRGVDRIGPVTEFLGPATSPDEVIVTSETLGKGTSIIVASDGLVDYAKFTEVTAAIAGSAAEIAKSLLGAAFEGGAGDNIAVAAFSSTPGTRPQRR
jgi:serine/threonine protein phosphatase PrpC